MTSVSVVEALNMRNTNDPMNPRHQPDTLDQNRIAIWHTNGEDNVKIIKGQK